MDPHKFKVGMTVRTNCISCGAYRNCDRREATEIGTGALFIIGKIVLDGDMCWLTPQGDDGGCNSARCVPVQTARIEGNELILEDV